MGNLYLQTGVLIFYTSNCAIVLLIVCTPHCIDGCIRLIILSQTGRRATTTAHLCMGHICIRIWQLTQKCDIGIDDLNDDEVTTDYAKKCK